MATRPAPMDAEDDRLLRHEVEAAIRSLTLVDGCVVDDLRRVLEELGGNDRHGADTPPPPRHCAPAEASR